MAYHDKIRAGVGERLDRCACVFDRPGLGVLARQIDGPPVMTALFEFSYERLPTPRPVVRTVYEPERCHPFPPAVR
jgi:hypothetical protein